MVLILIWLRRYEREECEWVLEIVDRNLRVLGRYGIGNLSRGNRLLFALSLLCLLRRHIHELRLIDHLRL